MPVGSGLPDPTPEASINKSKMTEQEFLDDTNAGDEDGEDEGCEE